MRSLIWSAYDIPRRASCQVCRDSPQSVVEVYGEPNAEQAEAGNTERSRIETAFYVQYCHECDRTVSIH